MPAVPTAVTFGWHLDARQGPLLESRFNSPMVGRQGLLGLLELHLGLAGPPVAQPQRVAAYLAHLRSVGERFFSRSLTADEMGVASELLSWRDEWLLYGWDGTAPANAPTRIADMASVEASARGKVPSGETERLQQVFAALESRGVPIEQLTVLDDLGRLPCWWQLVLSRLPVRIDSALVARAQDVSSTLGRVQQAALTATETGRIDALDAVAVDGSLRVFQSENVDTALHWLARQREELPTDQMLVCERDGSVVDDLFRANGEPACGFDRASAYRPALQALPLALELLWKPADVHRVLEFLTHPYGPFRPKARWTLARAYASQPGYGGESWADAKVRIKELDGGEELLRHVEFWFEGSHWTREEGAPLEDVAERITRVADALRVLLGSPRDDASAVRRGVKQAEAMLDAMAELKAQSLQRLMPRHIEQLLAQATSTGAGNPYAEPEVGCRRSATTTSLAALEPAREVVWWMPSKPLLPHPHPWSASEIESLRQAGTELRDTAAELAALAKDWLRPLMAARKRFTLVLPPVAEEEHPFWLLMRRLLPELQVRDIETELVTDANSAPVEGKPLPELKRHYAVRSDMTSRRERQSFTSLADLFDNPAVAVLKDAAAIRTATLMAVADEARLLGTLAHRLAEKLFATTGVLAWSDGQVRAWFDVHGEALVEAEGAPLLMLGFGISLHRFLSTAREGLVALLAHLQAAGAVNVRMEVPLEGELFDVPVTGTVDLMAEFPGSRSGVLDLKWSSEGRYRERLETGTQLQLAIYSSLVEQNFGRAPDDLAYFIFDSHALLATTNRCFPSARVCRPPPNASVADILADAEGSWRWRNEQLARGELELVDLRLGELDEFQASTRPTLPVNEPKTWNTQYVALLGWEEGA